MDMTPVKPSAASLISQRHPMIAIVDDDEVFCEFLSVLFKSHNCQVARASCGRELLDILNTQPVDCVVLDYNLVTENGLSIHEQIKSRFRNAPPIVILSGEKNERTIIKAFRGGVSDYVLKHGMKPEELFRAVTDALDRRALAQANDAELSRLKQRSEFDDATGLYSRHSIDERLISTIKTRGAARCAVILIAPNDLDTIAENFGQVLADRVLRAFVAALKKSMGPHDVCGRFDYGRFVTLTDVDVRFKTIEFTCAKLARDLTFKANFDAVDLNVTASIGAAMFPADGNTIDELFAAADRALAQAQAFRIPYAIASPPKNGDAGAGELSPAFAGPVAPANGAAADAGQSSPLVRRVGDRRAHPRQRVLKRGRIILPNSPSTIDCTVRDLSVGGARVRVEGCFIAPERFALQIGSSGEKRNVSLIWQIGNEFGVQFID
jgi:two-component system cell cycle response regulator